MDTELRDKLAPHNREAEEATLGAVLLDPDCLHMVLNFLGPEDFYIAAHQEIFNAFVTLHGRSQKIDILTLTDELNKIGRLDLAGGTAYLAGLSAATPSSANVEYYAKIVQENSLRRLLIKTADFIRKDSQDLGRETDSVLNDAQSQILKITQDRSSSLGFSDMNTLAPLAMKEIQFRAEHRGSYTGVESGFTDLDTMTSGFQDSELIIVGARPSIGKTAFALNMASHIAIDKKIPCAFFSLEMSDKLIMLRLIAARAKIQSNKLRDGYIKQADYASLMQVASDIYDTPLYITDLPNMKLFNVQSLVRRLVAEKGVKIIFIDYLTLITHDRDNSNMPRWEKFTIISQSLKSLARELKIPIVALAQLNRDAEGRQPTLSDLRESGSIEQDADVVMFLHRDRQNTTSAHEQTDLIDTELIIAKQRNGPVGKIDLLFKPSINLFMSKDREYS